MNNDEPNFDTLPESPTMALQTAEPRPQITAAQAKVDAVAALTMKAYDRASMLDMLESEQEALEADFPDEAFQPGAAGKEHLIYIQHAWLRDRLNKVFRPGKWSIVPRNRWAEDYEFTNSRNQLVKASRVYVEAMLVIRGCFVAEAVGEMEYYPGNQSQNYGDAVEGAKTAALRRCCKELGVGLQAWKKEWCEGWWERRRNGTKTRQELKTTIHTPPEHKNAPTPAKARAEATPEQREKMIKLFESEGRDAVQAAFGYFIDLGAILPTESLADLPLNWVPSTQKEMRELGGLIAICNMEGKSTKPSWISQAHSDREAMGNTSGAGPTAEAHNVATVKAISEDWHDFPMPWGNNAGRPLGELEKNYLFGLWANFKVETEYKGKPKSETSIAKDQKFRSMLDLCGQHYQFKQKAQT